ncbi:peptide deformylase [Candidatus Parcubacteria bacterium]|nr:peptide deformylase [Candidatus Parcubacteria bacterium]
MVKIVQKDDAILRHTAHAVPVHDITSTHIKKIISDMKKALHSQEDGVAIAAPQIGESLRIFVVADKAFAIMKNKESDLEAPVSDFSDMVFINPNIKKLSRKKAWLEEGCLSVRYLYGMVERSEKATVEAYNEKGEKFTYGASGLLAQIFQHETDHLNGVLFIDKAKDIKDAPPEDK